MAPHGVSVSLQGEPPKRGLSSPFEQRVQHGVTSQNLVMESSPYSSMYQSALLHMSLSGPGNTTDELICIHNFTYFVLVASILSVGGASGPVIGALDRNDVTAHAQHSPEHVLILLKFNR